MHLQCMTHHLGNIATKVRSGPTHFDAGVHSSQIAGIAQSGCFAVSALRICPRQHLSALSRTAPVQGRLTPVRCFAAEEGGDSTSPAVISSTPGPPQSTFTTHSQSSNGQSASSTKAVAPSQSPQNLTSPAQQPIVSHKSTSPPQITIADTVHRLLPTEYKHNPKTEQPATRTPDHTASAKPMQDSTESARHSAVHPASPIHAHMPSTSVNEVPAPRNDVASMLGLPKSLQPWAASITTEFVHRRDPLPHAADLQHTHYTRRTVTFPSHGVTCEAWLYLPTAAVEAMIPPPTAGNDKEGDSSSRGNSSRLNGRRLPPLLVMGHGLGSQKDMGLHPYAEQFAMAGMAVFVFDYRTYGGSEGMPRHMLSWRMYTQDWQAALEHVTSAVGPLSTLIDSSRVALWGESYSGGHVLVTAANNPSAVKAIVSAEPYLTARGALRRAVVERGPVKVAATLAVALYDQARQSLRLSPAYLKLIGGVEELSLLQVSAADMATVEKNPVRQGGWRNLGTASFLLSAPFYHPVDKISSVRCPTLFIAGTLDHICPAETVRAAAARMRPGQATIIERPEGHLELHRNGAAAEALQPVIEFLSKHLGLGEHAGKSVEAAEDEVGVGLPAKETPYG